MQTQTANPVEDVRQKAAEVASNVGEQAQQAATSKIESQKERAAATLESVAQTIRDTGDQLKEQQPQIATFTDQAAARIEDVSQYVRQHDIREVIGDAEQFARRQPAMFLGAAFAIGFVAARFVKASAQPQSQEMSASGNGSYGSSYGTPAPWSSSGGDFGSATAGVGSTMDGYSGFDATAPRMGYASAGATSGFGGGMTDGDGMSGGMSGGKSGGMSNGGAAGGTSDFGATLADDLGLSDEFSGGTTTAATTIDIEVIPSMPVTPDGALDGTGTGGSGLDDIGLAGMDDGAGMTAEDDRAGMTGTTAGGAA